MYVNSLEITKYQILEDLKIEFQIPKDNKNVVNIIAGVNGSGKTTLLNWILNRFTDSDLNGKMIRDDNINLVDNTENHGAWLKNIVYFKDAVKNNNKYENGIHSSPRVIFMPSNMTFNYQAKSSIDNSYKFTNIINQSDIIGNAEFFIKDYVIKEERLSSKSSPQERTKDAIDKFNSIFKDSEFITKLIDLDIHNQNRPIFETINGDKVTIDNLSSGEQQLYARVVALMILNPYNSVILIDEPEIALHPKWQIEIMKIYSNIGQNNQFIVTTHSPFIISQTPYKNLIFLVKENEKIIAKQFSEPPLDRDLNTIVKTIMGADYLPKELEELHNQYRKLFEENKLESQEAKDLEVKILEYESSNSSFFQAINFDKALQI
ncbi:MAG: AAA family ATPase [Arcobacteraceae bacterium]|nr:AAA family ATPase [Arcobacteraceae bacterium]